MYDIFSKLTFLTDFIVKAEAELLTVKRFIQILKPIETTTFVQQRKSLDSYGPLHFMTTLIYRRRFILSVSFSDMVPETSIQQIDKLCVHDEEIKSTIIGKNESIVNVVPIKS